MRILAKTVSRDSAAVDAPGIARTDRLLNRLYLMDMIEYMKVKMNISIVYDS